MSVVNFFPSAGLNSFIWESPPVITLPGTPIATPYFSNPVGVSLYQCSHILWLPGASSIITLEWGASDAPFVPITSASFAVRPGVLLDWTVQNRGLFVRVKIQTAGGVNAQTLYASGTNRFPMIGNIPDYITGGPPRSFLYANSDAMPIGPLTRAYAIQKPWLGDAQMLITADSTQWEASLVANDGLGSADRTFGMLNPGGGKFADTGRFFFPPEQLILTVRNLSGAFPLNYSCTITPNLGGMQ